MLSLKQLQCINELFEEEKYYETEEAFRRGEYVPRGEARRG
jgi:hypothetical protein